MDRERLTWLFGREALDVLADYDLDTEDDRVALVEEYLPLPPDAPGRRARMVVRTVAATQILTDDPPDTWRTARRLEKEGLDREQIMSELTMVIGGQLQAALNSNSPFDLDAYTAALDALPLPTRDEIAHELIDVARVHPGIHSDDHVDRVVASFSVLHSELVRSLVEQVLDDLIEGPLCWLPDDTTIHVPDLVDGRTFTHRYNDAEAELGVLNAGFDLGAFARFDTVRLADGSEIEQFSVERTHLGWAGPDGWLSDFTPDDLLSVTAEVSAPDGGAEAPVDAIVLIARCDPEPAIRDEVVTAVRDAYDDLVAEPGLPVSGEDLMVWLCHHRSDLFSGPQPPLAELCAAAGLEQRAGEVAHDEGIWRLSLFADRHSRALRMIDDPHWQRIVGRALDVLDDPDATVEAIRSVLDECAEPEVLDVLSDVLFPHYLDLEDEFEVGPSGSPGNLFELVRRAIGVAKKPREVATAEYLACVLHERCGAPEIAEQHLTRAVHAAPWLGPAVERMGWYRFDRGDARGAMRWWNQLEGRHDAAATIEPFSDHTEGRKLGRNDPCWCGSGRKFKRCHWGSTDLPALPDRIGWLSHKAVLWIEHANDEVHLVVQEMATARATGAPDTDPEWLMDHLDPDELGRMFDNAYADPIVMDAALHEGGLFALFLHERGALLPDDEQLLVASWMAVDRSVHEVVSVEPGSTVTMRDLASGDVVEIRERTASRMMEPGEHYCARVVPDGATHQIIGGVFGVRTGHASALLDLCAERDGVELCAWAGALDKGPEIVHTPGLIDEIIDQEAIEELMEGFPAGTDEETMMEALGQEIARQTQAAWLDQQVPALGGFTPREAAADPTRREDLVRLLDEFDRLDRGQALPGGRHGISWDIAALRLELGIDD